NCVGILIVGARASGALESPSLEARVEARDVAVSDTKFANAVVLVKGHTKSIGVSAIANPISGPKLEASARVDLGDFTTVRDAAFTASRDDVRALLAVKTVKVGHDQIHVEGLEVQGLGDTLRAEMHKLPNALRIRASTNELDLPKLSRLLRNQDLDGGHASF